MGVSEMASFTHSDALAIVHAIDSDRLIRTKIEGNGIQLTVLHKNDGETVVFVKTNGIQFQIWDVRHAYIDGDGVTIYAEHSAPVHIVIRD